MGSVSWQGAMLPRLQPCAPAPVSAEQHQPSAALAHASRQRRGSWINAAVGLSPPRCCHQRRREVSDGLSRAEPGSVHAPRPCSAAELLTPRHPTPPLAQPELRRPTGTWASETPRSARWSWVRRPVLGDTFWAEVCPFPAGDELASVAAALLDDHVLVVADDDFSLLVVQHGEGTHPDRGAGGAGHLVGLVELQQTLWGDRGRAKHHPLPRAGGAGVCGGSSKPLLPVCKHGWWA